MSADAEAGMILVRMVAVVAMLLSWMDILARRYLGAIVLSVISFTAYSWDLLVKLVY